MKPTLENEAFTLTAQITTIQQYHISTLPIGYQSINYLMATILLCVNSNQNQNNLMDYL